MLSIDINGVCFELLTSDEVEEYEPDETLDLPAIRRFAVLDGKDRDVLYRAAGYDVNKIDFAVPVEWQVQPDVMSRIAFGDRPVWSYETDTMMGSPVWDSEMYGRLAERILAEFQMHAV
jgi:hypothetical protein